jgi:hypothetical protein
MSEDLVLVVIRPLLYDKWCWPLTGEDTTRVYTTEIGIYL